MVWRWRKVRSTEDRSAFCLHSLPAESTVKRIKKLVAILTQMCYDQIAITKDSPMSGVSEK